MSPARDERRQAVLGLLATRGSHRGVCPDCAWDDHCQMCDCCCEPEES